MLQLLSGAVGMGSLVIALFFVRFWRSSGDRFSIKRPMPATPAVAPCAASTAP